MKDIFEILKGFDITVPEDRHKDLRRALSENYVAINEHNLKIDNITTQLSTANDTITGLKSQLDEAKKVDVKALQDKIKEYEDAEADRIQKENIAKENNALKTRFAPLKGEKKFLNEGTEHWMFEEFKKAITLEENKGRSDADIFAEITKDKNIYENPNQLVIPPVGNPGGQEDKRTTTLMKAMGIQEKGE